MTNVLFVCVQNAGRSQMAQALYERLGGSARSAGTKPAERVHPGLDYLTTQRTASCCGAIFMPFSMQRKSPFTPQLGS